MRGEGDGGVEVGGGYPLGQLAKAFVTAVTHEDPKTRKRAEKRAQRWQEVLEGMASGKLHIGSRRPVSDLPEWVTPEVVRGGFATGKPAAGGDLLPYEVDYIQRADLVRDRGALFAYFMSEQGLGELEQMLTTNQYHVEIPEEAALLTVAWLLGKGDRAGALELVDQLEPFARQLRFWPRRLDGSIPDPSIVWRESVGEVRETVSKKEPNKRVETMREALTVWNPFGDELLSLWLETVEDGKVAARFPEDWLAKARELLDRYEKLAATYTRCSKHRRAKENIAILRSALETVTSRRIRSGPKELSRRQRGLLQHAVDSMVRRRGKPGSPEHGEFRARQAANASQPAHHALAQVVASRLSRLPQAIGLDEIEGIVLPVDAAESQTTGIPTGTTIPPSIQRVVARALAGPVEKLIERGVVPSAEVLARLVPQIAASTTTLVYEDENLRTLMAANYRAFRNRRSLLLLNLEHQVQIEELPWVEAVAPYKTVSDEAQQQAHLALIRMGELTLQAFPATALPNPMIRELDSLAKEARLEVPFVEELAADIFMGSFSIKFLRASQLAGELLKGTLYERYYDIDYSTVAKMKESPKKKRHAARTSDEFDALCLSRAGDQAHRARFKFSVAANGMVIEQAQILSTHNLATLVHVGVHPSPEWAELAQRCLARVFQLVERIHNNRRPLNMIKDAAYAWRQMLFFMSLATFTEQTEIVAESRELLAKQADYVTARLGPAIDGLAHVLDGGTFDPDGAAGAGRRFLGWAVDGHWMHPAKVERVAG